MRALAFCDARATRAKLEYQALRLAATVTRSSIGSAQNRCDSFVNRTHRCATYGRTAVEQRLQAPCDAAPTPQRERHGLQGERRALLAQGHHAQPHAPLRLLHADYTVHARLRGVGLALEGQFGRVLRHVRDAAVGLEEAAPLFRSKTPPEPRDAPGALVVRYTKFVHILLVLVMGPLEGLDFSRLQFVDLLVAEVQATVDLS